jgi:hypothetical protein
METKERAAAGGATSGPRTLCQIRGRATPTSPRLGNPTLQTVKWVAALQALHVNCAETSSSHTVAAGWSPRACAPLVCSLQRSSLWTQTAPTTPYQLLTLLPDISWTHILDQVEWRIYHKALASSIQSWKPFSHIPRKLKLNLPRMRHAYAFYISSPWRLMQGCWSTQLEVYLVILYS